MPFQGDRRFRGTLDELIKNLTGGKSTFLPQSRWGKETHHKCCPSFSAHKKLSSPHWICRQGFQPFQGPCGGYQTPLGCQNGQVCRHVLLHLRWGTPDVGLLASRFNRKVPRLLARTRDHFADATDALVVSQTQYRLIYAFPSLNLLTRLLRRIEAEVILVVPDWLHCPWYADVVRLVVDAPWRLPLRTDLLSPGLIFHPAPQLLL